VPQPDVSIVCLLDDDPAVLKGIGRLLASAGLMVKSFLDPGEFLLYARIHRSPVAIIDIWMPLMNGLEVQSRLHDVSPSTRVIIFTGKEDALVRTTAMKAGACAFFIKPFDDEEFLTAVRTALAGAD
jgi:two-component system response regulator FixJ